MDNPYSPPRTNVEPAPSIDAGNLARLEKIRTGQRFVIVAILLYFGAAAVSALLDDAMSLMAVTMISLVILVLSVAMIVMALLGLFGMWSGLGTAMVYRIVMVLLLFLPLVGLLVLASSSARATKRLRANGYRVGLLGAGAQT